MLHSCSRTSPTCLPRLLHCGRTRLVIDTEIWLRIINGCEEICGKAKGFAESAPKYLKITLCEKCALLCEHWKFLALYFANTCCVSAAYCATFSVVVCRCRMLSVCYTSAGLCRSLLFAVFLYDRINYN